MMAAGVLLSQVVPLVAAPILTRLYSPADYGVLAAVLAVSGVLSVLATLRYELAIVLASGEREVADLLMSIAVIAFVVVASAAIAFVGLDTTQFRSGVLADWRVLAACLFVALAIATCLVGESVANRDRDYGLMAKASVARQVATTLVAMLLGVLQWGGMGLVLGAAIGYVLAIGLLGRRIWWAYLQGGAEMRTARVGATLRKYRQFPTYNLGVSLLLTVSRDLPVLAFTITHFPREAGLFAMARTITGVPAAFLSGSLSAIYYREAVNRIGTPVFAGLTRDLTWAIAAFSMSGFAFLVFWASDLFATLLGEQWRAAGPYAVALAIPSAILTLICWPNRLFEVRGRQSWYFWTQASTDTLMIGALVAVGTFSHSPLALVWMFAMVQTLAYLTLLVLEARLADLTVQAVLKLLIFSAATAAMVLGSGAAFAAAGLSGLTLFLVHAAAAFVIAGFGVLSVYPRLSQALRH